MRYLVLLAAISALPSAVFAQANTATPPSVAEMVAIYEINRARANPQAYDTEQSLGGVLAGITAAPPLALNERLVTSSRSHSAEMAANGYFAHQSAVTSNWPNLMVRNAGYPLIGSFPDTANNLESLAVLFTASSAGITYTPAAAIRALILDTGISPPGHRYHLLAWGGNAGEIAFYRQFREIGTGYAEGFRPETPYSAATPPDGSGAYWSIHTGVRSASNPWLCGVVYIDTNINGRYDAGEGISGATISATGASTLGTTSNSTGGWSIEVLSTGQYTVTCNGGTFVGTATANATIGSNNVWVDFRSTQAAGVVNFANGTGTGGGGGGGTIITDDGPDEDHSGCAVRNEVPAGLLLLIAMLTVLTTVGRRLRAALATDEYVHVNGLRKQLPGPLR